MPQRALSAAKNGAAWFALAPALMRIVAASALLAACALDVEPDAVSTESDSLVLCSPVVTPADPSAPMLLYYSVYERRADSAATLHLAGAPHERVIALNRPDSGIFAGGDRCSGLSAELGPWTAAGGRVAKVIDEHELASWLGPSRTDAAAAADRVIEYLHAGISYVMVDEIATYRDPAEHIDGDGDPWRNGHVLARGLGSVLEELARRGYDRRVILAANSYNLVDLPGHFHGYSDILTTCRDRCRVLASEAYITTRDMISPRNLPNNCPTQGAVCLRRIASGLDSAVSGINGRTITLLGVSDDYNTPSRTDSLCDTPSGGHGSLYRQYAALHAGPFSRVQPGIGGYALADVGAGRTLAQARCLNRLNQWRFPRAGGPLLGAPGAAPGTPGGPPIAPELCDGVDNDGNGLTDEIDCSHTVLCTLFDDGYTNQTPHVGKWRANEGTGACDGFGRCRRWFGRCVTSRAADGHQHTVAFHVHSDGGADAQPPGGSDAILIGATHSMIVPDGAAGTSRPYFGRGFTSTEQNHAHTIECTTMNGDTAVRSSDAITRFGSPPRLCAGGAGIEGCGVWVACRAR
jgi:hypothetical protein